MDIAPEVNKKHFLGLREFLLKHPIYTVSMPSESARIDSLVDHVFVCSFQKLTPSKIMEWIPNLEWDGDRHTLKAYAVEELPKHKVSKRELYVLDGSRFLAVTPR